MNKLIALLLFLISACAGTAQADTSYDFVRIACVPENGLLAVEYRMLHDAVSGDKRSKNAVYLQRYRVPVSIARTGCVLHVTSAACATSSPPRKAGKRNGIVVPHQTL